MNKDLKMYECHKRVHAKPMNRGDYNQLRGWDIPANENPADPGYLVIYNRDMDDEYISWSPANIFENGYAEIITEQPNAATGDAS